MSQCLFCKIIANEIPAEIIYRNEDVIAFKDINPQAPVHFLVVPVAHVADITAAEVVEGKMLSKVFAVIQKLAKENHLENGFRIVNNCGEDGGQTVKHLHFHLLGRRCLSWPPG